MRLILATALASLLVTPALADTMKHCAAAWDAMTPADKAKTTYRDFSITCLKSGYTVGASASGATATVPTGATAQCKDGTYSMSKTAQGRCSSHGGVAKVLKVVSTGKQH